MAGLPSRWVPSDPPRDPRDLDQWIEERSIELATLIADELKKIVVDAYNDFLDTLPTLTAAGDWSKFDPIAARWQFVLDNTIVPHVNGTYLAGGMSAFIYAPDTPRLPIRQVEAWANVINVAASDYMRTAKNRLVGIGDSVWNDMRNKTRKAIESGATNEDLKNQLQKIGSMSEYRADVIARTETSNAYLNGQWESNEALGDYGAVEKQWIATSDGRTRPSHAAVDNQVKPINEPFMVGGAAMQYPHDPAAPAKEVIQCRCVLNYLYEGDVRPDGSIVTRATTATTATPVETSTRDITEQITTQEMFTTVDKGRVVYDVQRIRDVHDPFIQKQMQNAIVVDEPTVTFMGGGPASGKSTLTKTGKVKLPDGHVMVNPDDAKDAIPEYLASIKRKDVNASQFVHEESSDMAKRLLAEAVTGSHNTILDGTGNGSIENLTKKVLGVRRAGAKRIVGEYVTVDTDEAVRRSMERGRRIGRVVPESVIRGTHESVSRVFPEASRTGLFDELRLWDNTDGPVLVYEKVDNVETIHRPDLWEAFLRKNPDYNG